MPSDLTQSIGPAAAPAVRPGQATQAETAAANPIINPHAVEKATGRNVNRLNKVSPDGVRAPKRTEPDFPGREPRSAADEGKPGEEGENHRRINVKA